MSTAVEHVDHRDGGKGGKYLHHYVQTSALHNLLEWLVEPVWWDAANSTTPLPYYYYCYSSPNSFMLYQPREGLGTRLVLTLFPFQFLHWFILSPYLVFFPDIGSPRYSTSARAVPEQSRWACRWGGCRSPSCCMCEQSLWPRQQERWRSSAKVWGAGREGEDSIYTVPPGNQLMVVGGESDDVDTK